MNRRGLLGALFALPFFSYSKKKKVYNDDVLGKALELRINQNIDYTPMFEQPFNYSDHLLFPIETELVVEYEKGAKKWLTFNYPPHKLKDMIIDKWFSVEEDWSDKFSPEKKFEGCNFRLSYVEYRDKKDKDPEIIVGLYDKTPPV